MQLVNADHIVSILLSTRVFIPIPKFGNNKRVSFRVSALGIKAGFAVHFCV
jgi:hypothetical protein